MVTRKSSEKVEKLKSYATILFMLTFSVEEFNFPPLAIPKNEQSTRSETEIVRYFTSVINFSTPSELILVYAPLLDVWLTPIVIQPLWTDPVLDDYRVTSINAQLIEVQIIVVPEFLSFLILPLFMALTAFTAVLAKRKILKFSRNAMVDS